MLIYKIFRVGKGGKEFMGALPERRSTERITQESIDNYARSVLGETMNQSGMILEPESMENHDANGRG